MEFFEYFIRGFLFFAFFWCAVRFVLTPIEGMETGEMIYAATHDFLAAGVPMALFGSTATLLAAALVFCALLTSPLTVRLAAWVYSHLLIPILLVLFMMVGMALALTAPLIQLLVDLARRTGAEDTIQVLMEKINEFSASFQELFGIPGGDPPARRRVHPGRAGHGRGDRPAPAVPPLAGPAVAGERGGRGPAPHPHPLRPGRAGLATVGQEHEPGQQK